MLNIYQSMLYSYFIKKDKYLEQEDSPFITVTLATVELVAPSESVTVNLQCKNKKQGLILS